MGKENLNLKKYLGYKIYKEQDDGSFDIKRIVNVYPATESFEVLNEDGSKKNFKYDSFKEYTPLEPYGIIMFDILSMNTGKNTSTKDVLISVYSLLDMKLNGRRAIPYMMCRQGIVDVFNFLNCQNPEDNDLVGLCVTKDNCPAQIDYQDITACSDIDYSVSMSFYRDDDIETILQCIPQDRFNAVLNNLYISHCKSSSPLAIYNKTDKGWCRDLKTLMEINNFMVDFNTLCGTTGVDFNLKDYLLPVDNQPDYMQLNSDALLFFDLTFKVNAVETRVVKYDYSINMGDFNNSNYTLLRDNQNNVYIVVYLVRGEYLEDELQKKADELSLSEKLRVAFYNKYINSTKKSDITTL